MEYIVYLSGEIHTDWREKIKQGAEALALPIISLRLLPIMQPVMRRVMYLALKPIVFGVITNRQR